MKAIYGMTRAKLTDWVLEQGHKSYRAEQIWQWLYIKRVDSFQAMTNLPQDLLGQLEETFTFNPLKTIVVQQAEDKTTKFLFELEDKMLIETVLMYHNYGLSVCVTTQIGCDIGCKFCASGLIPKQRDLEAGEIMAQLMFIQRHLDQEGLDERVSHIVVMGIGEPFDNYDNVMDFIRIANDQKGLNIGARRITVSTSGLAPMIKKYAQEAIPTNLAVSLHAPNDQVRSYIMRINNKYPMSELFEAIYEYIDVTNRRVTFEYIMIDGVNDQPEHAQELADLIQPMKKLAYVNLIPYNPVAENPFRRSELEAIEEFFDILMQNDINCVVRREHGTEIDAACGQLRSQHMKEKRAKLSPQEREARRKARQEERQARRQARLAREDLAQ
ncbi:23S rRNA (adenine(2503)-C(2))-methyltransferase RlmN [Hutsoniella sourekii]|uniref:23S rRNA (adenine(2503)-C(2))-methyltransferase RlmN n=1 Tax=Hutsoniella sourekii TaxID=87650 RepID=UPI0004B3AFFC|nr:23S rRNA (adenine(2503)-C(2))-methyltransferase RlmN [Hutsoniella sourekii]